MAPRRARYFTEYHCPLVRCGVTGNDFGLDLRGLLAAVEAAPPIEVVEVAARDLAERLGATAVSLLIANFSGTALVRMSHVSRSQDARDGRNERVEAVPLPDSIYQQVLSGQRMHLGQSGSEWAVLLPVTERGDAIGILELSLPRSPDKESVDYLTDVAHLLSYVLVTSRRHTDLFAIAVRLRASASRGAQRGAA